jgi:predicted anti-sigma-YlaC factor YlaD
MTYENEKIVDCSKFEESLTDYLDNALDRPLKVAMAEHSLQCPLCHALLNEVKSALEICHEISAPKHSMTHLEARILSMTAPETAMACQEFENYLTDYLDGFLPAAVFHRWERHAVLCENCTDLPGEVVRSIAACYTYKTEELAIPEGLHAKILQATIGTERAKDVRASWISQWIERLRGLNFPIPIPQLAPVAMIMMFAALFFSQGVSADSSFGAMYQKSFELAGQTYQQGANIVLGTEKAEPASNQEPINGTYINNKEGNN